MLDFLYGEIARWRRRSFERHPDRRRRLTRPVISVGNLSMGGTGKSPVVAALAAWLVQQGERPAILSRGYRRRDDVPGVVYDFVESPAGSGSIPMGHPKASAAQLYHSRGKDRRTTPP